MTVSQHGAYFRLLAAACEAQGAHTAAAKEELRQAAHRAAFGRDGVSAKTIDRKTGFDNIKSEFMRLADVLPSPPGRGQGEGPTGASVRLLHVARERLSALGAVVAPTYVAGLLKQRFKIVSGAQPVDDLTDKQLTDLIRTCNARIALLTDRSADSKVSDNAPF